MCRPLHTTSGWWTTFIVQRRPVWKPSRSLIKVVSMMWVYSSKTIPNEEAFLWARVVCKSRLAIRMLRPASFENSSTLAFLPNSLEIYFIAEHFVCSSESTAERIICSNPCYDKSANGVVLRASDLNRRSSRVAILKALVNLIIYSSLMSEYADLSSSRHPDLPIMYFGPAQHLSLMPISSGMDGVFMFWRSFCHP